MRSLAIHRRLRPFVLITLAALLCVAPIACDQSNKDDPDESSTDGTGGTTPDNQKPRTYKIVGRIQFDREAPLTLTRKADTDLLFNFKSSSRPKETSSETVSTTAASIMSSLPQQQSKAPEFGNPSPKQRALGEYIVRFEDKKAFEDNPLPDEFEKIACEPLLAYQFRLKDEPSPLRRIEQFQNYIVGMRDEGFRVESQDFDLAPDTKTDKAEKEKVEFIANYIRRPYQSELPVDDPLYDKQWGIPATMIDEAWQIEKPEDDGEAAEPVLVAIIDSGIYSEHPDLQTFVKGGRILGKGNGGFDFVSDPDRANENDSMTGRDDGIDDDPEDTDHGKSRSYGHGTHVLGTIAATVNNSLGVVGVATLPVHNVYFVVIRALGVGGGSDFDIINAFRYAAGLSNSSGELLAKNLPEVDDLKNKVRADIINASFGGRGSNPLFNETLEQVHKAGSLVVAAAGNEATNFPVTPASHPSVLAVGAVAPKGALPDDPSQPIMTRALFSNFGINLEIMAPGGDTRFDVERGILSTGVRMVRLFRQPAKPEPAYIYEQGTSMAAPHVTGIAAIVKTINPKLTNIGIRSVLVATANREFADYDEFLYGQGVVNAKAAVTRARELRDEKPLEVYAMDAKTKQVVATTTARPEDGFDFTLDNLRAGSYLLRAGELESSEQGECICTPAQLCGTIGREGEQEVVVKGSKAALPVEMNVALTLDPNMQVCKI